MYLVLGALLWGAVAAFSLVLGALLALWRRWPPVAIGLTLAFGAGALISSVAYELVEEGLRTGGMIPLAVGMAAGALTFYFADRKVELISGAAGAGGLALALGALLDGIPEQIVLGMGLAAGEGVSVALLASIFISNLPEGLGSAAGMLESGRSAGAILRLWTVVAVVCTVAAVAGFGLADVLPTGTGVQGFAAGALLVMLVDSMIPEAESKAPGKAGLAAVLGFAMAMALSLVPGQ